MAGDADCHRIGDGGLYGSIPGTPLSYADAFRRLQHASVIDGVRADHLVRAAGFRNVVAHAYETLDVKRVHDAATNGPAHLRAFPVRLRDCAEAADRR